MTTKVLKGKTLSQIFDDAVAEETARAEAALIARLGRKPLPEGEAREERTTIRWKADELAEIRRIAGDGPIGETIRTLALEAARARSGTD
jgi:hypothetical protein